MAGHDDALKQMFAAIRALLSPPEKPRHRIRIEEPGTVTATASPRGAATLRVQEALAQITWYHNVKRIELRIGARFFAEKCPTDLIGQQAADQLPWFHLVTILNKVSADSEREQRAEAAKLVGATAANLKELGHGG